MCFCASEVDGTVHPGLHNSTFDDISSVFFFLTLNVSQCTKTDNLAVAAATMLSDGWNPRKLQVEDVKSDGDYADVSSASTNRANDAPSQT